MKKLFILLLSVILLSGCGVFDSGNYDKDRSGYVLSGDFIVNYHTNSIGEIDVFMIDEVMSYFEALEYVDFDFERLSSNELLDAYVDESELISCNITATSMIPRFIRIEQDTYYFNSRENGYCTYDEYIFHEEGYNNIDNLDVDQVSPIENVNTTLFSEIDFYVNTFETIIYIENVAYDSGKDEWEKELVTALPMSLKQAGNMIEDNSDYFMELTVLEYYVLNNQSINLLELREDYLLDTVNNIWSEDTIDRLGRDNEVVKTVRTKKTGAILEIINDTLVRLGMF